MDKPRVNVYSDLVDRVDGVTEANYTPKIIRDIACIVAEPLVFTYKLSWNSGVVPCALKVA
jgi:hypothetical protein